MARIDQLDADRTCVDVADATPVGHAGMPGALTFLDQPVDGAVLVEDVMGTDLGNGVAQAPQRRGGGRHAGILQHHHVPGAEADALIEIGRRTVLTTHHHLPALLGTAFRSASSVSPTWVSGLFPSR